MKKYISIILTTLAIAGSSCKKDYLDLSKNPNQPSVTTPQLTLSGALKNSAAIVNSGNYTQYACWIGYLSWSTGYQANIALEAYQFTTSTYDIFTPLYANISNYSALESATAEPNFKAIAEIMIAYDFEALVDNYNNVPYSQALQGTKNLNPAYDNGSAIYDDIFKRVDAAIALIQKNLTNTNALNPSTSDIMYGGHMTNWIKFANTLKLRLALRQSNVAAKTAALKAAVAATASLGYIDASSPGVVNPGYLNSDANGGQQSPLWLTYGYTQNGGTQAFNAEYQANSYGAKALTSNSDVRGPQVYTTTNGAILSTAFGVSVPPAGGAPSKVGPGVLKSATMNANVITVAESLFLQAEGVKNGYIPTGDAGALYAAGITASYLDDGLTAAQAATYIAANPYPAADPAQEKAIITEKWKALAVYGAFEAFNEYRRTGYPDDIPLSVYPGANATTQVTRILYPSIEYQTNAANVAAQGTINPFTSKIFWAK